MRRATDADAAVDREGAVVRRPIDAAAAADRAAARSLDDGALIDGRSLTGRVRARADVVIVGSGAGGAVAGAVLAQAGLRVLVLEAGERFPQAELTGRARDLAPRVWRGAGLQTTVGNVPIVVPTARAVGGTTTFNSATCFRTPPALLERWAREDGLDAWTGEALAPFVAHVEAVLNVCPVPRAVAGRNAQLMERGARRLGWAGELLHRAVRGCVGSGVCASGCPADAKQHAGNTFLPRAHDAGATTVTGCRVERIALDRSRRRATGVEARAAGGARLRVEASAAVVVAAGTLATPVLLRRSGLRHAALGANLSLHPATGVWGEFDEPVEMTRGVPQAFGVDEFADEGFMLEGWAGSPDLLALALPAAGDEHRRVVRAWRHVGQCGLMIRDRSRGRVRCLPGGGALLRYDVEPCDRDLLVRAIAAAAELELAAGAHAVHVPIAGHGPVRTARDLASLRAARPAARALSLTAFHPLGTARASADPARGVVDADLRVHGVGGLLVADGSVVPSALGVNPQLTIMSLACRAAHRLAGTDVPTAPRSATHGRASDLVTA